MDFTDSQEGKAELERIERELNQQFDEEKHDHEMLFAKTPMNLDQLSSENEARRKVRDAATPGPWKSIKPQHPYETRFKCVQFGKDDRYTTSEIEPCDAKFIAYARNDNAVEVIDQLIAEVRRLTQGET